MCAHLAQRLILLFEGPRLSVSDGHLSIYIYICMCTYIHIYTHIYTCIYTYTYTYTHLAQRLILLFEGPRLSVSDGHLARVGEVVLRRVLTAAGE